MVFHRNKLSINLIQTEPLNRGFFYARNLGNHNRRIILYIAKKTFICSGFPQFKKGQKYEKNQTTDDLFNKGGYFEKIAEKTTKQKVEK